jgi:hypothetical protein
MMSDAIIDDVQDFEVMEEAGRRFVMVNVTFQDGPEIFVAAGSLVSCLLDEHVEIDIKFTTDDAFYLVRKWPNLSVIEFELHKGDHVTKHDEFHRISAIRMQEINPETQMSVIAMKLCKV